MDPNYQLVNLYRDHLLPEFGSHGKHDPWWWPIDPASEPAHWGLRLNEQAEFASLCRVPANGRGGYPGFGGSLTALPGCLLILGERPSFNMSYASAVTFLHRLIPSDLMQGGQVHIADVVKFRGAKLDHGLSLAMIKASTLCLADEIELLRPTGVIFSDMSLTALQRLLRDENPAATRLAPLLKITCEVVPHWKKWDAPAKWAAAFAALKD